ncbi:MAG TPA: metalloregulator ArsR/SmtB family transcription factor [Candidatus Krumholzibacteria bacterium]|nr:metalloregulator ArsR/SmtB family transcription factor [Candidatus Krumholzibacteria bacterium]HPD70999.1 metalloregulator ArsR/SmtB family transcription factor [Candidatus Krumholzibacteria bacterium]HRY39301.1 metalloregulator ArsR/SmtB family transcription factor [Candidatus Krumholzibacteria bacterium]
MPAFQAISDPTRLRLLRLLEREELNVQELVAILELRQPSVSRHLAVLRDAGWIDQRREGTWSWYRAVPADRFAGGRALQIAVAEAADRVPGAAADDRRVAAVVADREARSRELFAGAADHWDRIRGQYEHVDLQTGVLAALVPPDRRVIDVGTGSGALLPILASAAAAVVAVDHSAVLLGRARRRCRDAGCANVTFQRADVRALPFSSGSFDAAYSSMVLHHVADPLDAVRELARVVKPGGRVVVLEFTRHNLTWMRDSLAHRWLGFDREQLESWFAAAGLGPARWLQRRRTVTAADELPAVAGREGFTWPDVLLAVVDRPSFTETRAAAGPHPSPATGATDKE